jgi:hypothetical protein
MIEFFLSYDMMNTTIEKGGLHDTSAVVVALLASQCSTVGAGTVTG